MSGAEEIGRDDEAVQEGHTRPNVPDLRKETSVVAICCADIHLSLEPPLFRSPEPDWLAAQQRQLDEIDQLAKRHKCPVIIAGDIFDRCKNPPELINWTIDHLPKCYAVPGQHDLMYHSYADIRKTSYWTLVKAGKIINLRPDEPIEYWVKKYPIRMWGFPWTFQVEPCKDPKDMIVEIAVAHRYCWTKKAGAYPGAPELGRVKKLWKLLKGFDVAVFGDNHAPHEIKGKETFIHNCGTFYRRKSKEKGLWPSVGLIYADGSVKRYQLDISQDKFLEEDSMNNLAEHIVDDLVNELNLDVRSSIDFRDALRRKMDEAKVTNDVRRVIMKMLEEKR